MPEYSKIDLHTHSNRSDGELSPESLINKASANGIKMMALTDHDTISGLKDANEAAIKHNIKLINGIELSTQWENRAIHIVGLNIDIKNKLLIETCEDLSVLRKNRAIKIGQKLSAAGIDGAYEYAKKISTSENITRHHFAKFLVEKKYAKNHADVFKRFLVKNKPGYFSPKWPQLSETIKVIKAANGVAVIAHPLRYKMTATKLDKLMKEFKNLGGMAIEVITSHDIKSEVIQASNLAKKFNLSASIGSDFHNEKNAWNKFGKLPLLPESLIPVWHLWTEVRLS
ncbi:MAG: PHP domain-containing protein [Gammaproteobacteria bacterium]